MLAYFVMHHPPAINLYHKLNMNLRLVRLSSILWLSCNSPRYLINDASQTSFSLRFAASAATHLTCKHSKLLIREKHAWLPIVHRHLMQPVSRNVGFQGISELAVL
eukprot:g20464.t1